jgi:hypothetical protein
MIHGKLILENSRSCGKEGKIEIWRRFGGVGGFKRRCYGPTFEQSSYSGFSQGK